MKLAKSQDLLRRLYAASAEQPAIRALLVDALAYIGTLEHQNAALVAFANRILAPDRVSLALDSETGMIGVVHGPASEPPESLEPKS